jgi:hypothetical protein
MAYSYDEMQGEPRGAHEGSQSDTGTQVAGDVIDINKILEQRIKAADKAADRNPNPPKIQNNVVPHPLNPMGGY